MTLYNLHRPIPDAGALQFKPRWHQNLINCTKTVLHHIPCKTLDGCYLSGVSVIERIVEQARESKRRKDNILAAMAALSPEERREVLAELILQAEAEEEKASPTPEERPRTRRRVPGSETTFTDKAEAFILANPQGVKTVDVSKAIGQDASSVDGTLRGLMKRGRIIREGRLWVPVPTKTNVVAAQPPRPERMTIRDRITTVFKDNGNKPLGAAELFEALKRAEPEINRSSVDGEMNRMRKDNLLVQAGTGPHGGGLYTLKTEATTRPAWSYTTNDNDPAGTGSFVTFGQRRKGKPARILYTTDADGLSHALPKRKAILRLEVTSENL